MPHPPRPSRFATTVARRRYWSAAGRCLLLLAVLWHGPIPWCHCHGTLANMPAGSTDWLANHLLTCHGSLGLHDDQFLGWHLHVSFPPKQKDGDQDEPPFADQDRLPSTSVSETLSTLLVQGARTLPAVTPVMAIQSPVPVAPGVNASSSTSCFYGSYAADLPLPLRFGMLLI